MLNLGNDESARTQATSTKTRRASRAGQPGHRLLSSIRRPVGGAGTAASPAGEHPSSGRRPAPGAGPHLRQRRLPRAAHRLPVEGPGRHGHLLRFHGSPALPGVGRRRGVLGAVANRAGTLRRVAGAGLELVEHGRSHDQGPPGRGEKPAPTPRTGARPASNAVC